MRRGYIRIRKGGPDEPVQRQSLAAAGVNVDEVLGAVYVDGMSVSPKRRKLDPNDPLPQRTWAIRSLRPGDELVVHDAATLGTSTADILGAIVAIDRREATLHIVESGITYRWHPQAADIAALAKSGGEKVGREKTAMARKRLREVGGQRKVTPEVRTRALEIWSDPNVRSAREVSAILGREGVNVSVRSLYNNLPSRGEAIDNRLVRQGVSDD